MAISCARSEMQRKPRYHPYDVAAALPDRRAVRQEFLPQAEIDVIYVVVGQSDGLPIIELFYDQFEAYDYAQAIRGAQIIKKTVK